MNKLLLISTGGTIASSASEYGLSPTLSASEMLELIPEVKGMAQIDIINLLRLDSTNIQPEHWLLMAQTIKDNYERYDGFLITHGTDTMAYSAAALSYLIQDSDKPIIFTGAQKPLVEQFSDARKNLADSIRYLCKGKAKGVFILFDGKLILGTRARKVRSKSFAAFESINYPPLAYIDEKRIIDYYLKNKEERQVKFYDKLSDKVFLLKLLPGIEPDILEYLGERYDIIILETYGVGGVPFDDRRNLTKVLSKLSEENKIFVIATQVAHEGSDAEVYEVGARILHDYNVLQAYDMTIEALSTKLMWLHAYYDNFEDIKKYFYQEIASDIFVSN